MNATFFWCSALALCFAATLDLGVASLFSKEKGWPSAKEEAAVLGVKKDVYMQFCLSVRDEIKKVAGDSKINARVFNLMADLAEGSRKIIKEEIKQKGGYPYSRDGQHPLHVRNAERRWVQAISRPRLTPLYLKTLDRVVRKKLQMGVYSVCNMQNMQPLWNELGNKLREFHTTRADGLDLKNIGCKSVTRLNDAIVGCQWFMAKSRKDMPFIHDPEMRVPTRIEELQAVADDYEAMLRAIDYPDGPESSGRIPNLFLDPS